MEIYELNQMLEENSQLIFSIQMSELAEQMNKLQFMMKNQKQPAPTKVCFKCGISGHSYKVCPSWHNFADLSGQAKATNFYNQPPFDDPYLGWESHPNFSWNNNLNQIQPGTCFQSRKPTLEETLQNFIQATQTQFQNEEIRFQDIDSRLKNLEASIQMIGAQLEQVVDALQSSTFTAEKEVNANCSYLPIYDSPVLSSKCFMQDNEVEKFLDSNELMLELDELQQGKALAITESLEDSPEKGENKKNPKLKHVPYFSRYAFIGDDLYPPVTITSSSVTGIEKEELKECHEHIVKLDFVEEMEGFNEKNGFTIYEEEGIKIELPDEHTSVNLVYKVEALLGFKLFPVVKEPRHRKARAKSKEKGSSSC